nr:sulfotransferase family 2 domain-containing protein [Salinibacter ruber]
MKRLLGRLRWSPASPPSDMPRPPVAFIHIPKTAGTTFHTILRKQYGQSSIAAVRAFTPDELEAQMQSLGVADRADPDVEAVSGHMIFGAHRYLDGPLQYLTFVREPVSRVISDYYYVRRTPDHDFYDPVVTENYSLADYVVSGITIYTNNVQTRMISGIGRDVDFGDCTSDMLDRALHNLDEHFAGIGLTERFDESVTLMQRKLGWSLPMYKTRNRTKKRPGRAEIPDATRTLIREHNALDLKLYQYAKERFHRERSKQEEDAFERDLRRLHLVNRIYSPSVKLYISLRKAVNRLLGRDSW